MSDPKVVEILNVAAHTGKLPLLELVLKCNDKLKITHSLNQLNRDTFALDKALKNAVYTQGCLEKAEAESRFNEYMKIISAIIQAGGQLAKPDDSITIEKAQILIEAALFELPVSTDQSAFAKGWLMQFNVKPNTMIKLGAIIKNNQLNSETIKQMTAKAWSQCDKFTFEEEEDLMHAFSMIHNKQKVEIEGAAVGFGAAAAAEPYHQSPNPSPAPAPVSDARESLSQPDAHDSEHNVDEPRDQVGEASLEAKADDWGNDALLVEPKIGASPEQEGEPEPLEQVEPGSAPVKLAADAIPVEVQAAAAGNGNEAPLGEPKSLEPGMLEQGEPEPGSLEMELLANNLAPTDE